MQESKRKWTAPEEKLLWRTVENRNGSMSVSFITVAEQTGRSRRAVAQHYDVMRKRTNPTFSEDEVAPPRSNRGSRWTPQEDECLIRHLSEGIDNLHACFIAVSNEIDRSPCAVAAHWYTNVSKRPDIRVLFTASKGHISMNRKNGKGIESNYSIWERLLRVLRLLGL